MTTDHPTMMQRVMLEGWVNGYSDNRVGDDDHPIVSVFIPDGGNSWGMHGPTGTTVWMNRAQFDALFKGDLVKLAEDLLDEVMKTAPGEYERFRPTAEPLRVALQGMENGNA